MWNPGKLVIIGIFAVALASVGVSTWYHYQGARRPIELWGSPNAVLIAQAPAIEALKLGPPGSPKKSKKEDPSDENAPSAQPRERLVIAGHAYEVLATKDATTARGITNIRRALVLDPTFDWTSAEPGGHAHWQFALEFRDHDRSTTLLFDFDSRQVGATGSHKTGLLDQTANDDIQKFFAEQFEPAMEKAPAAN